MKRFIPLVNGEVYHILSRSIAEYEIFNDQEDYLRFINLLVYYHKEGDLSYSYFMTLEGVVKNGFDNYFAKMTGDRDELVQVVAYCIMPTHVHLILKQLTSNGISDFIGKVLNSYSKYFNTKHKRKGPLWEERFKNILVITDEQLLHLTRYLHLNPATALIVEKPEDWPYSSYCEYLGIGQGIGLCKYQDILNINPKSYRKFVNDRISYQRELAKIKALIID